MQLRWSPAAVEDLSRIIEYIRQENAPAAQRIAKTIYESAGSLKSFPNKGRNGRVEGTREIPLPPLPFVIVYRIRRDIVEIVNVIHGAQKWPPKD
jgi:addiction module RelE/StbE family toxin